MTGHPALGHILGMPEDHKYIEWGRRLKKARQALVGNSAAEMARQLGWKAQTYRNYERGDRKPEDYDRIRQLGEVGISLDWLFLGRHPMLIAWKPEKTAD